MWENVQLCEVYLIFQFGVQSTGPTQVIQMSPTFFQLKFSLFKWINFLRTNKICCKITLRNVLHVLGWTVKIEIISEFRSRCQQLSNFVMLVSRGVRNIIDITFHFIEVKWTFFFFCENKIREASFQPQFYETNGKTLKMLMIIKFMEQISHIQKMSLKMIAKNRNQIKRSSIKD